MSSRRKQELTQGALAATAGGIVSSAAMWWFFTSNLKQLIKTYEEQTREIGQKLVHNFQQHQTALSNAEHPNHRIATTRAQELTQEVTMLHQDFMSNLRSMARIQPIPTEDEAAA
jgi:uncharacterized protein with von Willebrand factor type A (vWA) domain